MKSPFPGMDPYLEAHWGDVHATLMVYARNQLNSQLPGDLQARVEESLSVFEDDELKRTVYPDVRVVEQSASQLELAALESAHPHDESLTALADPYVVTLQDDPQTWRHVEIVDSGGHVVTVIEFLSPANKVGLQGQLSYVRKQREFWNAGVNLVEIDLLRSGNYVLAFPQDRLPAACQATYLACVRRAAIRNQAELYPMPLRQSLCNIAVPLRQKDKDVVLRLQELIDDCYRDGRYDSLSHRADPVPRLEEADAGWAAMLFREKGLR